MFQKLFKFIKNEVLPALYFPIFLGKIKKNEYIHIIHTFFNLDYNELDYSDKDQYKNPEWLEERFILFEKYCLPSVVSQTDKNFVWVCHVHKDTPEMYKQKFSKYQKICPQLTILYGDKIAKSVDELKEFIKTNLPHQKKYLVSSRLDSDDAIAKDYIETIHKYLYKGSSYFIDFIYGYIYDAVNKKVFTTKFRRNPFSSRVEHLKNCQTIYKIAHDKINQVDYVLKIKNKPMWSQIIHKGNLLNKLDGDLQKDKSDFVERFKLND